MTTSLSRLSPSYFKLHVRWLRAFTPVTYLCKLQGIHTLAAFLQLELFRVNIINTLRAGHANISLLGVHQSVIRSAS
ncbi:hypothetical protein DP180_07460 [Enterobacter kobei]|uniref:Uncharacterized protein n=1 Tax=Enterobacter kobei TaxID=208224 RepID=A0ABX9F7U7_9ENTR|nr:hypothetical protein CEQ52_26455 [Enterobacter kobei]POV55789.1 hypothetical protein C3379_12035 [Enterobacter cloacae complex sp. ECNIH10]POV82442.1 hypothetical protein C3382_12065 [Enterobacter cloacae complex sp. ECNIH9]PWR28432.1 hypothetical protein DK504_10630 [Enterobacter kobei]RAY23328.1 hypothetical protein DP180_07460 [Enterobacter kobei]